MKTVCIAAIMGLLWMNAVLAQSTFDPGATLIPESRAGVISREAAALEAQARYGGRVLSVELERPQGAPPFYRVKLLSDGNVRVVNVNAQE